MKVVSNKLDPTKHNYKGLMLLVALDFIEPVNFAELSKRASQIKQDNFTEIWLTRKAKISNDPQGIYYFFVELIKRIKDKKPFFFKIPFDWARIKQEVNEAIMASKKE